jgi:ribosomal protein S18 acetylase RimI-like enzyme
MSGLAQTGAAAGSVSIRLMCGSDAKAIAQMHIDRIGQGFLSSFPLRTLTSIYRAVAHVPSAFGFVAEANGRCEGFIACATDLGRLYRNVLWRRGLSLLLRLLPAVFNRGMIRRVFETLGYPRKARHMQLPAAEVLSLATSEAFAGRGLGSLLMHAALSEFRRRGCVQVKVLVGGDLGPANRFYVKQGFRLTGAIEHHGIAENVYVIDLSHDVTRHPAAGG